MAPASATYDGNNRVTQKLTSDGNLVTYSYNDAANQVTQAVNGRFTRTTADGLGRAIRIESGDGPGTKSIADREYDSCASTSYGKVERQSLLYAPGGTPLWITHVYDGLGRTLQVQQPNSSGNTTYSYSGNEVTVTDPAGHWKKYTSDALGHLTQVNEPNPGGGTDFGFHFKRSNCEPTGCYRLSVLSGCWFWTDPNGTGYRLGRWCLAGKLGSRSTRTKHADFRLRGSNNDNRCGGGMPVHTVMVADLLMNCGVIQRT